MNVSKVYKKFPTRSECISLIEKIRWNGTPRCPYCTSTSISTMQKENRHHCNKCERSFSITVKTVFHHTRVDLQKRFLFIWIMLSVKDMPSIRQIAKTIGANPNTSSYMYKRIKNALLNNIDREMMYNIIENMPSDKSQ